MTSQVLCFQHHSRPWDQNDFDKLSNVLYYHEHQSAQCHITRSEFWAYVASQRKFLFRLAGISEHRVAPLIDGHPSRFRHAWNSQYSANINSFAVNNFLAKFELQYPQFWPINAFHFVYHCIHGNHHEKVVSKRKCSSTLSSNRCIVSFKLWWTSFTIIIIIRWSIIILSYYAGQYS